MKMLTCWAQEAVAGWVVAELGFSEQACSDRRATLGARHVRVDPGFLAGLDVLDLEVASIGHDRDPLHSEIFFCRFGGLCQQTHIHNLVCDLLLSLCLASTAICTLWPTATCVFAVIARLSGWVSEIWLSPVWSNSASISLCRSRIAAIFSGSSLLATPRSYGCRLG